MSDHILEFWESQARKFGTDHGASWGDQYAIALEVETIGKHIRKGDAILDIGCANGYSALHHLERGVASITGIDFSASMIEQAQARLKELGQPANVRFLVGDVRKIALPDKAFDVVYTTRVLINLPTWAEQQQGIEECLRVCKPGGKVVLCEAFWEPLVLLNAMRALKALPALVEHDFNRYIKRDRLEAFLSGKGLSYVNEDFSSVYYLGSRFLRELVTNPADYPGYSNPVNGAFYELERRFSGGGFGIQQCYVIDKP
jgi:ubiquinone/menaquinone biosynthesis C-methylase UbiE